MKPSTFLRIFDRYPLKLDYKGGMIEFRPSWIFVTSNVGLHEQFPAYPDQTSIWRRFDHVIFASHPKVWLHCSIAHPFGKIPKNHVLRSWVMKAMFFLKPFGTLSMIPSVLLLSVRGIVLCLLVVLGVNLGTLRIVVSFSHCLGASGMGLVRCMIGGMGPIRFLTEIGMLLIGFILQVRSLRKWPFMDAVAPSILVVLTTGALALIARTPMAVASWLAVATFGVLELFR